MKKTKKMSPPMQTTNDLQVVRGQADVASTTQEVSVSSSKLDGVLGLIR